MHVVSVCCHCKMCRTLLYQYVLFPVVHSVDEVGPSPRLCILHTWPDFQGYGFNLHAEKDKPGQFIGTVDSGSPAEASGLQEGDRIIEINDENIQGKSHSEVIGLIKSRADSVSLLVMEPSGVEYHRERGTVITKNMPNVIVNEAEDRSAGVHTGEKLQTINLVPEPIFPAH